jgi:hypothetical protein
MNAAWTTSRAAAARPDGRRDIRRDPNSVSTKMSAVIQQFGVVVPTMRPGCCGAQDAVVERTECCSINVSPAPKGTSVPASV